MHDSLTKFMRILELYVCGLCKNGRACVCQCHRLPYYSDSVVIEVMMSEPYHTSSLTCPRQG